MVTSRFPIRYPATLNMVLSVINLSAPQVVRATTAWPVRVYPLTMGKNTAPNDSGRSPTKGGFLRGIDSRQVDIGDESGSWRGK